MTIEKIYQAFEAIGCCSFTTIHQGFPESRIAHFIAFDQEGLYFSTMYTKPFYRQLKESGGKLSVCGMNVPPQVHSVDAETIHFPPGYFLRLVGQAEEVSTQALKEKNNEIFTYFLADQERYPAMVAFLVKDFRVEHYDYDFERELRDHKLLRQRYCFGSFSWEEPGFQISQDCINCGACVERCSFSALEPGEDRPIQLQERCDECGDCVIVCPVNAITHKGGPR